MSASTVQEKKVFGSLKYEEWPQIDRDLMQAAAVPKAFLRPDGPASSWRQTTCETVFYRYGVFLRWLRERERLSPSSARVARATPEIIADFVQEYGAGHASTSLAATLHGVYEAIRVMHPEADLSYLRDAIGALKANAKPRAKLPRMADHRALIELGEALIAHGAANPDRDHMLSAVAIRDGCMILFAVACPLRRSNFEALELGASLLRDELGYRVAFEASAMKNDRPFEMDLPDWLTPHLDLYCETARQTLGRRADAPDGGSLWLGAEGEPVTGKAISRKLRQLITRHLGRAMSLHLFRDGATTTVAVEASAEIGIAGDLLGHADPKTSEKYYNQARGVEASRRYHVALDDLRRSE
jgi:integrase/recombinase XerD